MDLDVVEELREQIKMTPYSGFAIILEHALAEIIRLNDIVEAHRVVHDEMYGRNSNAKSNELFK
jgi:hypothetical protein